MKPAVILVLPECRRHAPFRIQQKIETISRGAEGVFTAGLVIIKTEPLTLEAKPK